MSNILITGSANWSDFNIVRAELSRSPLGTTVITARLKGAGAIAAHIAGADEYPAVVAQPDWTKYPKTAAFEVNKQLLASDYDEVLAFGSMETLSPSAKQLVRAANAQGKKVTFVDDAGKRHVVRPAKKRR